MSICTSPTPRDRDIIPSLLPVLLTHYPIISTLSTHLHFTELLSLMLASRAVYNTILPSLAAIRTITCGGKTLGFRFGCWCCGASICSYCCFDLFLPRIRDSPLQYSDFSTPPWPSPADKRNNDRSIRHPASNYKFGEAMKCCADCWKKPLWWVKERFNERAKRMGLFLLRKEEGGEEGKGGEGGVPQGQTPVRGGRATVLRLLRERE